MLDLSNFFLTFDIFSHVFLWNIFQINFYFKLFKLLLLLRNKGMQKNNIAGAVCYWYFSKRNPY